MATRPAGTKYAADTTPLPRNTLPQLFLEAIDRYNLPNAQLIRRGGQWVPTSHRELLDTVRALSAGLSELGIGRDDRVALLSENRPEWAWTDYALLCIGGFAVPIYNTLPPNQISYILQDAGVRGVVVSNAEQLQKILEILPELPSIQFLIVFDAPAELPERVYSLEQVLEAGRKVMPDEAVFRQEALRATPDDLATLIYTSGTTGHPKGVMLTHDNLCSNVAAVEWIAGNARDNVALSFLPLSHVFERMVDYVYMSNGIPIAYVPNFDDVAQALSEVRPTIVCAVPRVYEKLYARILGVEGVKRKLVLWARKVALDWADYALEGRSAPFGVRMQHALADRLVYKTIRAKIGGRLKFFVSGSAPLNPQIAKFFYGAGVLILEGYGLTETSPVTNVNRPDANRIGTVGKPVPGTEVMIAADGEILVRGRQVMKGYYKLPEATAEAIDAEGWFHTGDIGDLDDDGFLRITDRKKELIKTAGGKYVAPQPIENLAKTNRFVSDAMLLGDRRPYPIMLVVPNFQNLEAWATSQQIRWSSRQELVRNPRVQAKVEEEMNRRLAELARFERPKKFVVLHREFDLNRGEVTPSLKLKRKVILESFAEEIEAVYDGAVIAAET